LRRIKNVNYIKSNICSLNFLGNMLININKNFAAAQQAMKNIARIPAL